MLDPFKSFSDTCTSPPALLDNEDENSCDMSTVQADASLFFLDCHWFVSFHNFCTFFISQDLLSGTILPNSTLGIGKIWLNFVSIGATSLKTTYDVNSTNDYLPTYITTELQDAQLCWKS